MLPWQEFLYEIHLSYMWLARFTRQYFNPQRMLRGGANVKKH